MKRKNFLKMAGLTAVSIPMLASLQKLEKLGDSFSSTARMPVLFLGHGSPMNGIADNEFVRGFKKQGQQIEKPNAIVVVSAHWETKGTFVTAMENPRTIHDFRGFPKELSAVQYPAPGHPELAKHLVEMLKPNTTVHLDEKWGLDHGSWTVVKHLFPKADVPIIQLSLDSTLAPSEHYLLAQALKKLRDKGILIIGSGNMVHNLREVEWNRLNENFSHDWALEASSKMKELIMSNDHQSLINYRKQGKSFDLAIPTPEHYLPLLYTLGLKDKKDDVILFNDQAVGGSLTMTSLKIG